MTVTWLAVEPLDTVMVRDGRAFDAGAASAARSVAPPPSTLGGVVRTVVGADVGRILGPVVSMDGVALFPAPQDLVRSEEGTRRLALELRDDDEVSDLDDRVRLPYRLAGDGDPVGGWLTGAAMGEWLAAEPPVAPGADLEEWITTAMPETPPWVEETRLGLARRWAGASAGTAVPGMLYTANHLRPHTGTRFLLGCVDDGPVSLERDIAPLGGRSRMAHVSIVDTPGVLPRGPETFPGGRVAVYLVTPALLDDVLWQPPGARLCAVATSGPVTAATASPRAGFADSRRLSWAVPAGSAFYLELGSAEQAAQWSARYHGDLLPQKDVPIVTAGFGLCLTGRW